MNKSNPQIWDRYLEILKSISENLTEEQKKDIELNRRTQDWRLYTEWANFKACWNQAVLFPTYEQLSDIERQWEWENIKDEITFWRNYYKNNHNKILELFNELIEWFKIWDDVIVERSDYIIENDWKIIELLKVEWSNDIIAICISKRKNENLSKSIIIKKLKELKNRSNTKWPFLRNDINYFISRSWNDWCKIYNNMTWINIFPVFKWNWWLEKLTHEQYIQARKRACYEHSNDELINQVDEFIKTQLEK